jgi:hypothetical protein
MSSLPRAALALALAACAPAIGPRAPHDDALHVRASTPRPAVVLHPGPEAETLAFVLDGVPDYFVLPPAPAVHAIEVSGFTTTLTRGFAAAFSVFPLPAPGATADVTLTLSHVELSFAPTATGGPLIARIKFEARLARRDGSSSSAIGNTAIAKGEVSLAAATGPEADALITANVTTAVEALYELIARQLFDAEAR